jgi:hypothetical protein
MLRFIGAWLRTPPDLFPLIPQLLQQLFHLLLLLPLPLLSPLLMLSLLLVQQPRLRREGFLFLILPQQFAVV